MQAVVVQAACCCRLSKNHRGQVIRKQSLNSRRKSAQPLARQQDANVETRVLMLLQKPRRRARKPRLSTTVVPGRKGGNPRLYLTAMAKTQSLELASQASMQYPDTEIDAPSHMKLNAELAVRISQTLLQWQNARLKARVSVITALITGLIIAHVMRELTPIMECF